MRLLILNGPAYRGANFPAAKQFGVTYTLNPTAFEKPIQEVIKEMTDGGADFAVECVGNVHLMKAAVECTHDGWGRAVIVGLDDFRNELSIYPGNFLYGRTLTGTIFGDYKGSDIDGLVKKYMNKELNLDGFITHKYEFSRINEAFQLLIDGNCLRCVLEF